MTEKRMGRPVKPNKLEPGKFIKLLNGRLADNATYNPDNLLDALIDKLELKNDAQLARVLQLAPPIVSKIRHRRLEVSAAVLVRMHDVTQFPINFLRELMGVPPVVYDVEKATVESMVHFQ